MRGKWAWVLVAVMACGQTAGAYEIDPMLEIYGSLRPEVIFRSPESGDAKEFQNFFYCR